MIKETLRTVVLFGAARVLTIRGAARLSVFIAAAAFFAAAAAAQTGSVIPILECVTTNPANGLTTVFIGYNNTTGATQTIPSGTGRNLFSPGTADRGQPSVFYTGERRAAFSVGIVFTAETPERTFTLDGNAINISAASQACRTGAITYQGRLTNGGAQASGNFDLQFQLFTAATGGASVGSLVQLSNVTVSNGVFTVALDFGAGALATPGAQFLEIGVRPSGGAGAYTTLQPRQPLTDAPSAVFAARALSASNAENASNADNANRLNGFSADSFIRNSTAQQSGNLNLGGSGRFGGTVSANNVAANGFLARGGVPGANGANNNGYAFDAPGDNDSGLFSDGNGAVSLYTNAGERVRATDAGATVSGNLTVTGAISAATKNFKIDHPLDPLNKTLTYTSVESPEMLNIYNGNAVTDGKGEAIVQMPAYFAALNRDFRYQLTVIGTFAQAIVGEEITNNRFVIRTDKPNVKVSWQVTGVRRDKFADENRPAAEQNKAAAERGRCLYAPNCAPEP